MNRKAAILAKDLAKPDRQRGRTREALLKAGRSLLAARDVDCVSVDEIVAAAAVAKGSFYNYFPDKDVFAREIGSAVRRQVEQAVAAVNADIEDPAASITRGLCVFLRFAIEHRDSAQVLWRFHSGATMADAPINRGLRTLVERGIETERFKHVNIESGVLLVMGVIVIALRHAFEERLTTAPAALAQHMSAGLLRALGIPAAQAERLSAAATRDVLRPTRRIDFD